MTSVLEGSVRKIGNRIRITAQLVNVENGYQLWSETYDRQLEDVFAMQDEISRAIVDALKLRLGGDSEQAGGADQEPRGVQPLSEGRASTSTSSPSRASERRSTCSSRCCCRTRDTHAPTPASPTAGASWPTTGSHPMTPIPGRRRPPTRALQLDPELAEAMTSIGKVLVLVRVGLRRRGAGSCGAPWRSTRTTPRRTGPSAACCRGGAAG